MNLSGGVRKFQQQAGAAGLLFTAVSLMLVSLAALSFLYSLHYGHWPMQELWANWSGPDKAGRLQQEIRKAAGQAGAADSGVRRCVIAGKVTYSNVECGMPAARPCNCMIAAA